MQDLKLQDILLVIGPYKCVFSLLTQNSVNTADTSPVSTVDGSHDTVDEVCAFLYELNRAITTNANPVLSQ